VILVALARGEDELAVVSGLVMVRRGAMKTEAARCCCGGDGDGCFRRVAVVAGEEIAAAAAMVGGREIRVRVSCVRWRR